MILQVAKRTANIRFAHENAATKGKNYDLYQSPTAG